MKAGSASSKAVVGVGEEKATTWSSKLGFLMALIGGAVGLGSIWRFPYLVGENGGGAFILIYLCTSLLIALPILIAEIMLGRMGKKSPITSISLLVEKYKKSPFWKLIGYFALLSSAILLSYYAVIGGWTLKYFFSSFTGHFQSIQPAQSQAFYTHFMQSAGDVVFWHALFMGMICLVILAGVQKGIERTVAVMTPLLFCVLVGLIAYACTLKGFPNALNYTLDFDFSKVKAGTFLAAIGHSFFSLSVGQGAMMMYGAYSTQDSNIPNSSAKVFASTAFVATGASVIIFTFIFTFGLATSQGTGLTFVTLPIAFGQMGLVGLVVGTFFFLLLSIAAIGPSISLLQPSTVWLQERLALKRLHAVLLAVAVIFSFGLFSAFSGNLLKDVHPLAWLGVLKEKNIMDTLDYLCSNIVMLLGVLGMTLFVGWALPKKVVAEALNVPASGPKPVWFTLWFFFVRYFAPTGILIVFLSALLS